LIGVSHLDLINWTNRLKWWFWELTGSKRKYDGVLLSAMNLANDPIASTP
jgi:triacylglycerol lipase